MKGGNSLLPYQEEYVRNVREAVELSDYAQGAQAPFKEWHEERMRAKARIAELKQRNTQLLNEELFPTLDALHSASQQTLDELTAFADALLDWKINLDPGVYVTIHDALLSLYRVRRDRNSIIRELYKLGMGLYYQRRAVMGVDYNAARSFYFENEMVFAEAASYFRHFEEIGDEETQGYIIRSIANIALCAHSPKQKIAASGRTLQIIRDPHYREVAPGLPWDRYLRSTHQQMSVNRTSLSRGNLTQEELSIDQDWSSKNPLCLYTEPNPTGIRGKLKVVDYPKDAKMSDLKSLMRRCLKEWRIRRGTVAVDLENISNEAVVKFAETLLEQTRENLREKPNDKQAYMVGCILTKIKNDYDKRRSPTDS